MSKRPFLLLVFAPLVLSSCSLLQFHNGDESEFKPTSSSSSSSTISSSSSSKLPDPVLTLTSGEFIDAQGHLTVHYECNYLSPYNVDGHEFGELRIMGSLVYENSVNHQEKTFTVLSPVIQPNLKFEFYDKNKTLYLMARCYNITMFGDEPGEQIVYPQGYNTLYWADEFDGNSLDTSKWTYETGNGDWGWGNGEMEYYTDSNDTVSDGVLTITAKREEMGGFHFTSTRIKTQNKVKFTYGYIEARIALPNEQAMWPAFWMMPNDSVYGWWPNSGEIDIMEAKGRLPTVSSSAIHFSIPNSEGNNYQHTYLTHEETGHNIVSYHKYAVEWQADFIKFFIDDNCHVTYTKSQWMTYNQLDSDTAPFDKDFYIILNLAVGGQFDNWVEPRDGFTSANMLVDYVRVFKK